MTGLARWGLALLMAWAQAAHADESWARIPIGREAAYLPAYVLTRESARATLVLLPGGDAETGAVVEGRPGSGNFLSRSRDLFADAGFHVIVLYRASDLATLDNAYRAGREHLAELAAALSWARERLGKPVWLVGTSRGTVSAAAAGIALEPGLLQGVVLTSSITNLKSGGVPGLPLASLKLPTLVLHHRHDACRVCLPQEASQITRRLTSAPVKRFVMVEGGSDPRGDPCHARHWHGFINYERETVALITEWIRDPKD
jgi:hypothetical protein